MCPIHPPSSKENRSREGSRKKLRLATFRLRTFVWEPGMEVPLKGFGFISEFSPSGAGLYLEREVKPTSVIRLSFEAENGPTYRAMIMWANRFTLRQGFNGHDALTYRLGVRYQFVSEAERQRYIKYLEEIRARAMNLDGTMKF